MIPFNKAPLIGNEKEYIFESISNKKISGDGSFSNKCHLWFEKELKCEKALLTPSCTHALEMTALLLDIKEGDEIIMPSYTFVSTANAFVLRGAKIIFVDIRPDTMNIDEMKIEEAITSRTKVIVPVHYAGIACEMDVIMDIAKRYNLFVVEDAAQAMMSKYKEKYLGTIGHFGTFSFHETKNYTSAGEGGLLIINDKLFIDRAEIIREKGTNRSQFFRGDIDKYSWVDIGSSYLMNELSAAYLFCQLTSVERIYKNRLNTWNHYYKRLINLQKKNILALPFLPEGCIHNSHMFYIKVRNSSIRKELLSYLNNHGINACFHYIPLHSSVKGKTCSSFINEDEFTTLESEKLIRLPLFYQMSLEDVDEVCDKVIKYYEKENKNE